MKILQKSSKTLIILTAAILFLSNVVYGQVPNRKPFPYVIENNTPYPDNEVFVAIVGEDTLSTPGNHVWVDCKTGQMKMMNRSDNTVFGPAYYTKGTTGDGSGAGYDYGLPVRNEIEGNRGPFSDRMYANCFARLSEIPNKTIMLPCIQGCRIFFSFKQQLYLCFLGSKPKPSYDGAKDSGYSGPAVTDPTDPNLSILWDMIELTYDKWGYFANTSRVDSYNYPMGTTSIGQDLQWNSAGEVVKDAQGKAILLHNTKKVGDKKTHTQIVNGWKEYTKSGSGREEFQTCLLPWNEAIIAPAKTKEFADGSVGTMPKIGVNINYFQKYIDAIWETYKTKDLVFDSGEAGIWTGRVDANNKFSFVSDKKWGTEKGYISRKPNTQEVLEGKGCLDQDIQNVEWYEGTRLVHQQLDRVVQAQLCAAINRHVVPVDGETLPKPLEKIQKNGKTVCVFSDSTKYYQVKPSNYYAAYWHQGEISMEDKAYGFCYDDVWSFAPSSSSFLPEKVIIHLNGFAPIVDLEARMLNTNQYFAVAVDQANLNGSPSTVSVARAQYLTYSWTVESAPGGSTPKITNPTAAITTITGLAGGQTKVRLTVSDGLKTHFVIGLIDVKNGDPCTTYPDVNAGATQDVSLTSGSSSAAITLTGTASDPASMVPGRGTVTTTWAQTTGPACIISSTKTLTTGVTGLTKGTYTFELTASLSSNCNTTLVSKSTVTVNIIDNTPCVINTSGTGGSSFSWSVTLAENPVITFIPKANESKAPVVIIYKLNGVDKGGYNAFTNMQYTFPAKTGDKIEFYYVYSLPAGGEGNSSTNWQTIIVGTPQIECKATAENPITALQSEIELYPNPTNSTLSINLPEGLEITNAQIVNTAGVVVKNGISGSQLSQIDVSDLTNGIYFVLLNGEKTIVKKFVKN